MYRLFAVTTPGLEPYTRQELVVLGITARQMQATPGEPGEETGGVEFEASLSDLYRANLYLRTANRILARLGEFHAAAFSELRAKASRLPWEQHLRPSQPVAIRVTCRKSRLYHSDGVAERVAGAIEDRLHRPVQITSFDENAAALPQLVVVRLVHDECTISVDTSGALLHRRGYRLETAKAPLRETLAAGLLLAVGWDLTLPLLDPFCGSGTIPIEAAMLAGRVAPGKNRRFAFMDWPNFDTGLWQSLVNLAVSDEQPVPLHILASDRDAGAIQIALANAGRAGVAERIQFTQRAFSAIEPPQGGGWIVTNPPYGERVSSDHDLRNLYSQLGKVLRTLCPGWKVGILCNSDYLVGHSGLRFEQSITLVNGGIPVKFYVGRIA